MRCKKCDEKITIKEWLFSVHTLFEKGFCERCEIVKSRKWVDSQIKLIKEGKRFPPKIC